MISNSKNKLFMLLSIALFIQFGCEKTTTTPNSTTTKSKFYSHYPRQTSSDLVRTSDGGYIMVGTAYSSTLGIEGDILVIKVDSLGVEEWSSSYSKVDGSGSGTLTGKYVRHHEEGIKIVELPNAAGYAVAANRSYVSYTNSTSTTSTTEYTKVVLYQLSSTGVATTTDGVELKNTTASTEKVSDFKLDNSSGSIQYILTGYTTQIATGKPTDPNNSLFDKTDIFTILLEETFIQQWSNGVLSYGFAGEDYGTSVQVLSDGYLVIATIQEQYTFPSGAFVPKFAAIKFNKSNGVPTNIQYFGDANYTLEGGHSSYDATNQKITIVGNVVGGNTSYVGQLVLFQIDNNLTILNPSGSNTNTFGFEFFNPAAPSNLSTSRTFKANSIAALPNNSGFVLSATMSNNLGKDICILKTDAAFVASTPYYYGYNGSNSASTNHEIAGTVIPVINNNIATKYAFTGTFDANTASSKAGWIRF